MEQNMRLRMEDYQLLHQLGSGSYGAVHLALHIPSNNRQVIKRIKISHLSQKEIEDARQEVQVLSGLLHPYITHFQGSCEEDGCLLIAMDYCAGGDMQSLITKRNGVLFPEDRVLDWFVQLCLAIKYIHDRKILHRDIKSQNIFLTDAGKVRLGDFGIAKILNSSSDLARTCIGTPYYLSPEMCENKPYNNKSDIWALGCVLYEMLTLKHAFEATNMKALIIRIIKGIYPPVPARYSRELRLLLAHIFQRDPLARPSISAILRKAFIFKRVSRFISDCEEEDLKASLVRKKCPFPASARRIPVVRRPSDVTEPSAKYGVSMNKRTVSHKSPIKSASRNTRPANYEARRAAARVSAVSASSRAAKRTQKQRCPSENDLLANGDTPKQPEGNKGDRYQRRSKSVPNAFKQGSKPQEKAKEPFSPVKLQLMLDSAGLRQEGAGACVGAVCPAYIFSPHVARSPEACNSPESDGWLVDEFLMGKLQFAYKKRKLVEALVVDDSPGDGCCMGEGVPQAAEHNRQDTATDTKRKKGSLVSTAVDGNSDAPQASVEEHQCRGNKVQQNQKEEKDKANESLRQLMSSSSSEEDSESAAVSMVTPDTVRQIMQDKMKKLIQRQTHKMSMMIQERREWAYQKEKVLDKVTASCGSDEVFLLAQINGELKEENGKESKSKVGIEVNEDKAEMRRESECVSNLAVQSDDGKPAAPVDDTHEPLKNKMTESNSTCKQSIPGTVEGRRDITQKALVTSISGKEEQLGKESCASNKGTESNSVSAVGISEPSEACHRVSEAARGSDTSSSTSGSHSSSSPSKRGRWKLEANTAGLENSPLESTGSGMDSTNSTDCVVVYREAGDRKQWQKENKDIVHLLSEAQIMRPGEKHSMDEKNGATMLINCGNNKSSVVSEKCVVMSSTFTLKDCLKDCPRGNCKCAQVTSTLGQTQSMSGPLPTNSSVLNSTFNIMKEGDEKIVLGPPLLNSTFEMEKSQQSIQELRVSCPLNSTYKVEGLGQQETSVETPAESCVSQPGQCNVSDVQKIDGGDCVVVGQESLGTTKIIKDIKDGNRNVDETQIKDATFTLPSAASSASAEVVSEQVVSAVTDCSLNVELRNTTQASTTSEAKLAKTESEVIRRRSRGSIFEKFKLHMSPQAKQKHQHSVKGISHTMKPQSTSAGGTKANTSSIAKGTASEMQTPVLKRKGKLKTGLVGIIKRLSSKPDVKPEEKYACVRTERSEPGSGVSSDTESLGELCRVDPEVKVDGMHKETVQPEHHNVGSVDIACGSTNRDSNTDNSKMNVLPETLEYDQCAPLNCKANGNQEIAKPEECSETENKIAEDKSEEESYEEVERLGISGVVLKIDDCSQTVPDPLDEVKKQIISTLVFSGKEAQLKPKGPPIHCDNVSIDSGLDTQQTSICQPSDSVSCSSPSLLNCTLSEPSIGSQSPAQQCMEGERIESVASDGTKTPVPPTLLSTPSGQSSPDNTSGSSVHCLAQLMVKDALELAEKTLSSKSCDKLSSVSPVSTSNIFIDVRSQQTVDDREVELPLVDEKLPSNSQKSQELDKTVDISSVQEPQGESQEIQQDSESDCVVQKVSRPQPLPGQGSPGRPRPTVLNVGAAAVQHNNAKKMENVMTATQLSIDLAGKSLQNSHIIKKDESCKSEKSLKNRMKQGCVRNKVVTAESESEEEAEDVCSMRQSRELLLCARDRVSLLDLPATSSTWGSEVWHLDCDGIVVPGGGGVYGWIEEQRAKLEDTLGLSLFIKAYHHLEEAQEREGCVVGEAVSQVEQMLGHRHHHLAYDILQLVVAEAVYHN